MYKKGNNMIVLYKDLILKVGGIYTFEETNGSMIVHIILNNEECYKFRIQPSSLKILEINNQQINLIIRLTNMVGNYNIAKIKNIPRFSFENGFLGCISEQNLQKLLRLKEEKERN